MKIQMYTVYDAKATTYQSPWFAQTNGVAVRMFIEAVNSQGNLLNKFPDDFMLMHIGHFDDQSAQVVSEKPVSLGTARSFIKVDFGDKQLELLPVNGKTPVEVK